MRVQVPQTRRDFIGSVAGAVGAGLAVRSPVGAEAERGRLSLRYLLASCMYGYSDLAEILPEVSKAGAAAVDTWPKVHGNQREQLDAMGERPDDLDGTLRLYLGRFLHLVVDLELDAPESDQSADALSSYGDYRSSADYDDFGGPRPVRYRINEDRILRSGELRYFDHPKFGVLARVTRVEDESEESVDPMETELLGYPVE